ncbi:hypothetical protein [Cellulomonas sp. B6]|uniref:hypothetical protein n=1 Tax=Cellulomonas sp. B6 TaxID=1295626 RepID=UPI00073BE5CF|nr:hypothetical protein [Cellulomonas sp. B6]KSW30169.1 hypothetical protein ATM99_04345 [Cellulomonas sp. B6]
MRPSWIVAARALTIGVVVLITATSCASTPTPSTPTSRVPPAFDGYDIANLDPYFGGAWVHTGPVKTGCGPIGTETCAHLLVANDPACTEGFYANVQFKDEYGDAVDKVRGRALGVNPDTLTTLDVPTASTRTVKSVTVESAGCI